MMMEARFAITVGLEWILLEVIAIARRTLFWSLGPIVALTPPIEARGRPLVPTLMAIGIRRSIVFIVVISVRVERRLCEDRRSRRALFVPLDGGSSRRQEG